MHPPIPTFPRKGGRSIKALLFPFCCSHNASTPTLPRACPTQYALFEDQEETTQIMDIFEGISFDHNQVRELADLHRAEISLNTTQGGGVFRSC